LHKYALYTILQVLNSITTYLYPLHYSPNSIIQKFPFLRLLAALVSGALVASIHPISLKLGLIIGGIFLFIYLVIVGMQFISPKTIQPLLSGVVGLIALCIAGYLTFLVHSPPSYPHHINHINAPIKGYEAIVQTPTKTGEFCDATTLVIQRVCTAGGWQTTSGKVRLYWPQKAYLQLSHGQRIVIKGSPHFMLASYNPDGFDYVAFWRTKGIYHQHFIQGKDMGLLTTPPTFSIAKTAFSVKSKLVVKLQKVIPDATVHSFVIALLLGEKTDLAPTIQQNYAKAGAAHVLALSGLHVGLLYLILLWLLQLLSLLPFFGRFVRRYKRGIAQLLLWSYAFITGFSPSVVRAVTMFSLISFAQLLYKNYHVINIIFATAFCQLLYQPQWLAHPGFQLSYAAILGIVSLHPILYRQIKPPHWILQKLWEATSVSLVAQIATLPLILHYFHSFPTYFLLANWIAIPATTAILILGLLAVATASIPIIHGLVVKLLSYLVFGLHGCMSFLANSTGSQLLSQVDLGWGGVIWLYVFFFMLGMGLYHRKFSYLVLATFFALGIGVGSSMHG